ncbi:hypothetical protein [Saccharothrix hoggarensis]|uniref:Secreted protein with PEP-CTERM sorting signal n=1 Tax=Saccharothrix hoggarensis TaxID=913853 RepID=A0ABW3QWK6_9PSEU
MLFAQGDPMDMSSPILTVLAIATLVAALVVGLRALWHNRKR